MTFLNPLLLFGLFAAAIPIIIHLLTLRKLKTVEFSTLQFLKELQKTKMRRVKIRQWLLLALRTLLVIATVLAFSRPALRGSLAGFGLGTTTHARTTIVILLDDSPSMSVRNERGMQFTQAKDLAQQILGLVQEGDEAYVLPFSHLRHTAAFVPSHDAASLKKMLTHLSPSYESVPLREVLGVAAKILAESKNVNRELYLLTDAQASQLQQPRADTTDLFDDHVKLFLADVQRGNTSAPQNAGITNASVTSKIITLHKPVVLQATIHNAGPAPLRNAVLSVYLDGARVSQHSLDVAPGGTVSPTLSVTPKRPGLLTGYLQIEDDALEADNKRWFTLNVPKTIVVLCTGASSTATRIATLALTLDADSAGTGLFSVDEIPETQLSSRDLSRYDLLLLSNVQDFSTGEAERIEQFVSAGGGVLMFAGNEMNITNYNQVLFARLGIPQVRTMPPELERGRGESFLSFSKIEFDHPLFTGLFDRPIAKGVKPSIESPRIFKTLVPGVGTKGNSIITLSDGTSFLTEYEHGEGKILLFSVEAGTTWSDFPLKGIFVPLLYRSGQYLAQGAPSPSVTAGEEMRVNIRLKQRSDRDRFVLRSPSGVDERVVPQFASSSGAATFSSTSLTEPGIYELRRGPSSHESDLLTAIAVNISADETDLRHADTQELEAFFATVGLTPNQVRPIAPGENLETAVMESRFGIELWKFFILLALACAVAEMAIGRESKAATM